MAKRHQTDTERRFRLNITVSYRVMKRLAPFQAHMNISAVCDAALEAEGLRLENLLTQLQPIYPALNQEYAAKLAALEAVAAQIETQFAEIGITPADKDLLLAVLRDSQA